MIKMKLYIYFCIIPILKQDMHSIVPKNFSKISLHVSEISTFLINCFPLIDALKGPDVGRLARPPDIVFYIDHIKLETICQIVFSRDLPTKLIRKS